MKQSSDSIHFLVYSPPLREVLLDKVRQLKIRRSMNRLIAKRIGRVIEPRWSFIVEGEAE